MSKDEQLKRVQTAVDLLGEHFDTVQVFVTRHEPAEAGGTETVNLGCGNWYARYGQVVEWIVKQDAQAQRHATIKDDEDE